jgi:hypothetical protein
VAQSQPEIDQDIQGANLAAPSEFAFLLACIRSFFQPGSNPPSASGLDWPKLIQLADRHAVMGLFSRALQSCPDIPANFAADLRQRATRAALFDLTLSAEMAGILDSFQAQRIAVMTLKGPALGKILYGHAALRRSVDLDLLIHPPDVPRAIALLRNRGYSLRSTLPWRDDLAYLRRRDAQMSFSRTTAPNEELWVDLHWRLLPGYFPRTFDERETWLDPRHIPVSGAAAPMPAPENTLLFLAAHGAKHLWERLSWICDIARLIQVEPDMDWPLVFTRANATGTRRLVVLALLLSSQLLGVTIPQAAAPLGVPDPQTEDLVRDILARLEDPDPQPVSAVQTALFSRRVFEHTGQRLRFIFGIFARPTEAEYLLLKLPRSFDWVYYLVRPVRLAAKYAEGRFFRKRRA